MLLFSAVKKKSIIKAHCSPNETGEHFTEYNEKVWREEGPFVCCFNIFNVFRNFEQHVLTEERGRLAWGLHRSGFVVLHAQAFGTTVEYC